MAKYPPANTSSHRRQSVRTFSRSTPDAFSTTPEDDGEVTDKTLSRKAPLHSCRNYALWLLGRREWSAKELRTRLKSKGYSESEVDDCLEFCRNHALQSDERFAASRTRMRSNSHGNRRILQELTQKGVSPETSSVALAEAGDEGDRAYRAAQRYAGHEMTVAMKSKAWRFLASRGFGSDTIKAALRRLAEESAEKAEEQV